MPRNYNPPPDEPAGPSETVLKFPVDVELHAWGEEFRPPPEAPEGRRAGDCVGGAMTDKPKTPFEISTDELAQGQTPSAVLAVSLSLELNPESPAARNIISLLQSRWRKGKKKEEKEERAVKRTVRRFVESLQNKGREVNIQNLLEVMEDENDAEYVCHSVRNPDRTSLYVVRVDRIRKLTPSQRANGAVWLLPTGVSPTDDDDNGDPKDWIPVDTLAKYIREIVKL